MWLVRDGDVLATVEVAERFADRHRGLLGRETVEGALLIRPCRQVHTFGMRVPIDVAFCDREGRVLRTMTLRPWRISPVVWRSTMALEASAGAFERWRLREGDRIEVRGACR